MLRICFFIAVIFACLLGCMSDKNITVENTPILPVDDAPNAPSMQEHWTIEGYTEYDENRHIKYWLRTITNGDNELTEIRIKDRDEAFFGPDGWTWQKYQEKARRDSNWERLYYELEWPFSYETGFESHEDVWASLKGRKLANNGEIHAITYRHANGYSILFYPGDWENEEQRFTITDPRDNNVKNTPWLFEALRIKP